MKYSKSRAFYFAGLEKSRRDLFRASLNYPPIIVCLGCLAVSGILPVKIHGMLLPVDLEDPLRGQTRRQHG